MVTKRTHSSSSSYPPLLFILPHFFVLRPSPTPLTYSSHLPRHSPASTTILLVLSLIFFIHFLFPLFFLLYSPTSLSPSFFSSSVSYSRCSSFSIPFSPPSSHSRLFLPSSSSFFSSPCHILTCPEVFLCVWLY